MTTHRKQPIPRSLSKSRYVSGLQCHLKLWFDCYQRNLAREVTPAEQSRFDLGHHIGELATRRHRGGLLIEVDTRQPDHAIAVTQDAVSDLAVPAIFEATFRHEGVLIRADILARVEDGSWDLIEVKSSTKTKPVHTHDLAVQCWVLRGCGLSIARAGILTLDSSYVYEGGDYDVETLFRFHDLTDRATEKSDEVAARVASLHDIIAAPSGPDITVGPHCSNPYQCAYTDHCSAGLAAVDHPITELPSLRTGKREDLEAAGIYQIAQLSPAIELTTLQARVRDSVQTQRPFVSEGLVAALATVTYPVHHLDFETFMPALPRYAGTSPYQALPFQWSNHVEHADGTIEHRDFLCRDDMDPREAFARSLIAGLGSEGAICIYTPYEIQVINRLAAQFPDLSGELHALVDRCWDLCAVIKVHYYEPAFRGSFSLKSVLPALVPHMTYDSLEIGDGQAAAEGYLRALTTEDPAERDDIFGALVAYCTQDTLAMVELRRVLTDIAAGV